MSPNKDPCQINKLTTDSIVNEVRSLKIFYYNNTRKGGGRVN